MARPGKYSGPFLSGTSLTSADLQYILAETGATTNVKVLSHNTVTPAQMQVAFNSGQTAPPAGYVPPIYVQASIDAWRAWRAAKQAGKRGRDRSR